MTVYVSFRKMCVIPYFVIPNIYSRNICSLTKKSPHESQQKSCLFRVIPNIYLRNLCSVTKDSPQESQQKRLSFLFRGGAWSSLSHMSEYPKCLSNRSLVGNSSLQFLHIIGLYLSCPNLFTF